MLLLSLALLAGAPAHAADTELRTVADVLARFDDEPDVSAVQEMVLQYSKTDNSYVDAWLAASKSAAALPQLQLKYNYANGLDNGYDYIAADATADPIIQQSDAGVGIDHKIEVKARWDLNELVMSSERIRVISETQDIVKLRDKVLDEVTRLYFDRRRLQVDMLLNPGDMKAQLKNELRLQELTAQIDAYTGGRFSTELAGAKR
jgi:hypothetical protein